MKYLILLAAAGFSCIASADMAASETRFEPIRGEEIALRSSAPYVPLPITRRHATKVLLEVEVKEHTRQIADGVSYTYWTFGDDAPGNSFAYAKAT